jgi:hypothetical protein
MLNVLAATLRDIYMIRSYRIPSDERTMTFVLYVLLENKMRIVWTAGKQTEVCVIYAGYESDDKLSLKKLILQDLTLLLSLNS